MDTAYSPADGGLPPDILKSLRVISEPSRARVIEYLGGGERCVCDLGTALHLSPALASHHLRALRSSGLIRERRAGRWVYYALDLDRLEELRAWLDRLLTPSGISAATDVRSDCDPDSEARPQTKTNAQPLETR
jgi:ArsR family transcriptional regulator